MNSLSAPFYSTTIGPAPMLSSSDRWIILIIVVTLIWYCVVLLWGFQIQHDCLHVLDVWLYTPALFCPAFSLQLYTKTHAQFLAIAFYTSSFLSSIVGRRFLDLPSSGTEAFKNPSKAFPPDTLLYTRTSVSLMCWEWCTTHKTVVVLWWSLFIDG